MNSAMRLWATTGLILAACVASLWVRSGYSHVVTPPSMDVRTLPEQLAEWRSVEERSLDERTSDVLGADAFVHRVYENPEGRSVSIQVAVWTDHSDGPTGLHYPEVCYRNAGWTLIESAEGKVRSAEGQERPFRLMLMEKDGARIVTGHWYQMGEWTFFSANEARTVHRRYWGQREWPCEVKVLLQISAPDLDTARPLLEEFAAAAGAWTEKLH